MSLVLLLLTAWVAIWELKIVELRHVWHDFNSCAVGLSTSRAVKGLLQGLVLTATSTFIYHSELLLRCNLTLNRLNLLVSRLLRLTWYYTRLFQLTLFNGANYRISMWRSRALLMVSIIYTCRNRSSLLRFLQLLLLLTLLLPGFQHMYLILLYFLDVLNLLLLQILHFYWCLWNLLFGSVCSILAGAFWLLKFVDVHVVIVVASGWNDLLLVNVLWTLVQVLLDQFRFWNVVAHTGSGLLLHGVSGVAVAVISSDGLTLFHVFVLTTEGLESLRLPLVGGAVPYAGLRRLRIYHRLVSVCRLELLLRLSIDVDVDDVLLLIVGTDIIDALWLLANLVLNLLVSRITGISLLWSRSCSLFGNWSLSFGFFVFGISLFASFSFDRGNSLFLSVHLLFELL